MAQGELSILLALIDQAFDHHAWHGTNLRGSIRGLSAAKAAWRPASNRHNIWETVVHAAYWKYIVRRRILSETKGSFQLKGSNWFNRPVDGEATEAAWKADVALLIATHKSLRAAIEQLSPKAIKVTPEGSTVSNLSIIMGIASHDLYHAGQIQLLKRLQPK